MNQQKFRWSKVYESSEEELQAFFKTRNLKAERVALEAYDEVQRPPVARSLTVWCAEGSLTINADNNMFALQPGDALQIPAGSSCGLGAGISGCVLYETRS